MTAKKLLPLLFVVAACASIQPVPYSVQPGRIADPRDELANFIKLNTTQGCLTRSNFDAATMDVEFVCSGAVGHALARFDRVQNIRIEQYQEWYRLVVEHSAGIDPFMWTSKSLEDVQRAADAVEALAHPAAKQANGGATM